MTRELAYSILLLIITLIAFSNCYLPKKVKKSPILTDAKYLNKTVELKQKPFKPTCYIGLVLFLILSGLIVYWGFFDN